MVQLEEADYKLAVDKAQSALNQALADFEIEKGPAADCQGRA